MTSKQNNQIIKVISLLYISPLLLLFGFLAFKNIKTTLFYLRTLFRINRKERNHKYEFARYIVGEITEYSSSKYKVLEKSPRLRIVNDNNIDSLVLIPPLPFFPDIIILTTGAVNSLSKQQLEALIAHEVGHIVQRHTSRISILNFISKWTFLGEGYLIPILGDLSNLERKADEFAILWLEREENSHTERSTLIELLENIEKHNIKALLGSVEDNTSHSLAVRQSDWIPVKLRQQVDKIDGYNIFGKLLVRIRILFFLYYNSWLSAYVHQPYDVRLKHIKEFQFHR